MSRKMRRLAIPICIALLLVSAGFITYTNRQFFLQDSLHGSVVPLGAMNIRRAAHSATVLKNGIVLIAGGMEQAEGVELNTASTEFFDPSSATFKPGPNMTRRRAGHTATLLPSGDVLIAGGFDEGISLQSAEIFRVADATFEPVVDMLDRRDRHTATLLANGLVLVVGGNANVGNETHATAELFDPQKRTFVHTGRMSSSRSAHTATLLNDGKVLITGGSAKRFADVLTTAEVYDPADQTFTSVGSMSSPRHKHGATLLRSGNVLITGGSDDASTMGGRENTAEVYDPTTNAFQPTGAMVQSRFKLTTAVVDLASGKVVVAGDGVYVEVYNPQSRSYGTATGRMADALMYSTAVRLQDGSVLIAGGYNEHMKISEGAWLYRPI